MNRNYKLDKNRYNTNIIWKRILNPKEKMNINLDIKQEFDTIMFLNTFIHLAKIFFKKTRKLQICNGYKKLDYVTQNDIIDMKDKTKVYDMIDEIITTKKKEIEKNKILKSFPICETDSLYYDVYFLYKKCISN